MNRVVHFELNVEKPEKTVEFFKNVFGWEIAKWEGDISDYWSVVTGKNAPGINGGITITKGRANTVNTIEVSSIDESLKKVVEAGGSIIMEKKVLNGMGWLAYCSDPQGIIFGLIESDPSIR